MPRRIAPVLENGKLACGDLTTPNDAQAIQQCIERCHLTSQLLANQQGHLIERCCDAVAFARIGLRPWLTGKDKRPEAWALDVFTQDLMRAWQEVGLHPTVRSDATGTSAFLSFAADVAASAKLLGARGSLFHNALRARGIEKP